MKAKELWPICGFLLLLPLCPVLASSYSVWVCMPEDGQIRIVNSTTYSVDAVLNVSLGEYPWGISFTPKGDLALVLCRDSDNIVVLDARTGSEVGSVDVGESPFDLAVPPDGGHVYVANSGDGTISVVEIESLEMRDAISVGGEPAGLDLSLDGEVAYVCIRDEDKVAVVRLEDRVILQAIGVDGGPWDIDLAPNGEIAYVSCEGADRVNVVDLSEGGIKKTVQVNPGPRGLSVLPSGKAVYVPAQEAVAIIETNRNTKVDASGIHGWGWRATVTPDSSFVFVSTGENPEDYLVEVIDTSIMEKIESIWLGEDAGRPAGLAVHPLGPTGRIVTSISLTVSTTEKDSVLVEGGVLPPLQGVEVLLSFTRPNGTRFDVGVTTDSSGKFSQRQEVEEQGEWRVSASWTGDEEHEPSEGVPLDFTPGKSNSTTGYEFLGTLGQYALVGVTVLALLVAAYSVKGGRDR